MGKVKGPGAQTVRCHNLKSLRNSRISSTGWIIPGLSLQGLVTHQCAQCAAELGLSQAVAEPMPCSEMNAEQLTLLLPQPPQPGCCSPLQLRNPPFSAFPSHLHLSRSWCCAESTGVPQGSAPGLITLICPEE